jgi:hypothetical protein
LSFLWAYLLPIISPRLTWILRNELTSPSTNFSTQLQALTLFVPPLVSFIATIVYGNKTLSMGVFLGMFCWFIAHFLPFSTHLPIYPFERVEQN